MTREIFITQERDVFNRFSAPVLSRDYALLVGREYRCACGFRTADAGAIYDHGAVCKERV
jgi:hypothetical protein